MKNATLKGKFGWFLLSGMFFAASLAEATTVCDVRATAADEAKIRFGVMSDIHLIAERKDTAFRVKRALKMMPTNAKTNEEKCHEC